MLLFQVVASDLHIDMSIIFLCCNNVRIYNILKKSCIENAFFLWGGVTSIFSSFVVVVVSAVGVVIEEEEEV